MRNAASALLTCVGALLPAAGVVAAGTQMTQMAQMARVLASAAHPVSAERRQSCRSVPGTQLEQFYPLLPGWQRGTPSSETDTTENVSRATVDFDRGVETISVEIMDSCRNADVLMLIREALKEFPPGGPGTTQQHTTVNTFPAYEEFTAASGHGEIHVMVAERFMIKVTADTSTLPTLRNATALIPLAALAALR